MKLTKIFIITSIITETPFNSINKNLDIMNTLIITNIWLYIPLYFLHIFIWAVSIMVTKDYFRQTILSFVWH